MDRISTVERSRVMSLVRSSANASTELKLAKALRADNIRGWVSHSRKIGGCPDFAFPELKVAIFVDGCFWHGCPSCYRAPKSSQHYWRAKVKRNSGRDLKITRALRRKGWSVLRVWEHSLRNTDAVVQRVRRALKRQKVSR